MINVNDLSPQMIQSLLDKVEVLEKMFYDYNGKGIRSGTITGDKIVANSITAEQIDATNLHVYAANIDGAIHLGPGASIDWGSVTPPTASQVGALDSSYSNRLTKITSSGIYTGTVDAGQITSGIIYTNYLQPYTDNVLNFSGGSSLDCRGGAVRLRYDSYNYVYISSNGIDFYCDGTVMGGCDSGGLYTRKTGSKVYV